MKYDPEILELSEEDAKSFTQGKPPLMIKIRWWLIRKIAGRIPVFLNIQVSPHTRAQCSAPMRVMHCTYGLFSGHVIAGNGCGITMQQIGWTDDGEG